MSDPQLCLHVGVHKTATTHLQKLVEYNRELLESDGVSLYLPSDLRPHLGEYLNSKMHPEVVGNSVDVQCMVDTANLDESRLHLVLEENILGRITQLNETLYPRAKSRLELVIKLFGLEDVRLFICVREYADYYRSSYLEFIRGRYYLTFEEYLGSFDWRGYSWSELITEIVSCVSPDKVTVYEYRHYREVLPSLLSGMTQMPPARLHTDSGEQIYPSPSNKALAIVENSRHILSREDRRLALEVLEKVFPKEEGESPVETWRAEHKELLNNKYHEDIEGLKTRYPGIRFLEPA